MTIRQNISLKDYSTMRLGGNARALVEVHTKNELLEALEWAEAHQLPALMLGGGSNVIFRDGYDGLVIINHIAGFELLHHDDAYAVIRIGAGENWDKVVAQTVEMGLSGIEKLSLIPGTAGATPVQNVGAYGAEIADTFVELEAYDLVHKQFVTLDKEACKFSYRSSIFKSLNNRRYIITSITLRLSTAAPKPPFYAALQQYLDDRQIKEYSPKIIREAVIAIRTIKLPDPSIVPNTGSFFKNPIVDKPQFEQLLAKYPHIPNWPLGDGRVKLPAGWLVEHAGLKGYKAHGMKTYEYNALVFVNYDARTYEDLAAFREEVISKIQDVFGITLEQEPELI